jgi:Family of unknown function (DUF6454)
LLAAMIGWMAPAEAIGGNVKRIRTHAMCAAFGGALMVSAGQPLSSADDGRITRRDNLTTELFQLMGRNTIWTLVDTVKINWPTFHTQGLVKIGETFYVSAVEVRQPTPVFRGRP